MSIHAPGSNKPLEYLKEQGADQVQVYNSIMEREIKTLAPEAVVYGGIPILDWFGSRSQRRASTGVITCTRCAHLYAV